MNKMIKRLLLFYVIYGLGLFTITVSAQEAGSLAGNLGHPEDSLGLGEALVTLAWENYPENNAYRHEVDREQEMITQARWSWLDDIGASFNLNEGNLNPEANATNIFFPRYNFRISINAGTFINTPSRVRQAKIGKEIAHENVAQQELAVRREVLSRYYTYLYNLDLLKLRMQSMQDVQSAFTAATRSFNRGEVSLEEYNEALNARNAAEEARIQAERELVLSKLNLEELIGMSLERAQEVVRNQRK